MRLCAAHSLAILSIKSGRVSARACSHGSSAAAKSFPDFAPATSMPSSASSSTSAAVKRMLEQDLSNSTLRCVVGARFARDSRAPLDDFAFPFRIDDPLQVVRPFLQGRALFGKEVVALVVLRLHAL